MSSFKKQLTLNHMQQQIMFKDLAIERAEKHQLGQQDHALDGKDSRATLERGQVADRVVRRCKLFCWTHSRW